MRPEIQEIMDAALESQHVTGRFPLPALLLNCAARLVRRGVEDVESFRGHAARLSCQLDALKETLDDTIQAMFERQQALRLMQESRAELERWANAKYMEEAQALAKCE